MGVLWRGLVSGLEVDESDVFTDTAVSYNVDGPEDLKSEAGTPESRRGFLKGRGATLVIRFSSLSCSRRLLVSRSSASVGSRMAG